MSPRRKIIFLDFDGVMVNHKSWYVRHEGHATADPPCVEALNRIISETGAAIVVSSTWRIGARVTEMRKILSQWGVVGTVIGYTPRLQKHVGLITVSQPRGSEIHAWLDEQKHYQGIIESFVILDDDGDMEPLKDRLVQTKFEVGLTMADAEKAISILAIPVGVEVAAVSNI